MGIFCVENGCEYSEDAMDKKTKKYVPPQTKTVWAPRIAAPCLQARPGPPGLFHPQQVPVLPLTCQPWPFPRIVAESSRAHGRSRQTQATGNHRRTTENQTKIPKNFCLSCTFFFEKFEIDMIFEKEGNDMV